MEDLLTKVFEFDQRTNQPRDLQATRKQLEQRLQQIQDRSNSNNDNDDDVAQTLSYDNDTVATDIDPLTESFSSMMSSNLSSIPSSPYAAPSPYVAPLQRSTGPASPQVTWTFQRPTRDTAPVLPPNNNNLSTFDLTNTPATTQTTSANNELASATVTPMFNIGSASTSSPVVASTGASAFATPLASGGRPTPAVDVNGGRLGPSVVRLSRQGVMGPFQFTEDDLEAEAHCNFGSCRATTCVYQGKWQYEVTLGTAGIQQLGWCTISTPFTLEEGAGDSNDSYAYDGKRVKKWNQLPVAYGESWACGDVIGCFIDLAKGEVSFSRNGKFLGVAYENVRTGEGIAYFPAASLSYAERSLFNFGGRPFDHPVAGFTPLQAPPQTATKAQYLVDCVERIVRVLASHYGGDEEEGDDENDGNDVPMEKLTEEQIEDLSVVTGMVFEHLAPLLTNQYVFHKSWYPMVITFLRAYNRETLLDSLFDVMDTWLEEHEAKSLTQQLWNAIGLRCRTLSYTSFAHSDRSQLSQSLAGPQPHIDGMDFNALELALVLLKDPRTRRSALEVTEFPIILEHLLTMKQPSASDLAVLLPRVWWPGCDDSRCSEAEFRVDKAWLSHVVREHEELMTQVVEVFTHDTETLEKWTDKEGEQKEVVMSQYFVLWLREVLEKNKGVHRNIVPAGMSDSSVLINLYFIVLGQLEKYLYNEATPKDFPNHIFVHEDPAQGIDFFDLSRVGGLISHIKKTATVEVDTTQSVLEDDVLFDSNVLLYSLGMSARFKQAAVHQSTLTQTLAQCEDFDSRVKTLQANGTIITDSVLQRQKSLKDEAVDLTRQETWYQCLLFPRKKQDLMFLEINVLVQIILRLSAEGDIFQYVPEFYLEALVDSFHALRRGDPVYPLTAKAQDSGLGHVVSFLVRHFNDPRIVNLDVRDLLLHSISVLLQYGDFVRAFEDCHDARTLLIPTLLSSYDNKFWVPISNILLRFWRGIGFGQGARRPHECASSVFRGKFSDVCRLEPETLAVFLNKLFNNLNWAVSEFGVALKDLMTAVSKTSPDLLQAQRKVSIMFELSANLLRIIEFISLDAHSAFENELNVTRLVELVLLVINRSTTGPDAALFDSVLNLDSQLAPDKISKPTILAPVIGILLNLDIMQVPIVDMLAEMQGFNPQALKYIAELDWMQITGGEKTSLDHWLGFSDKLELAYERKKAQEASAPAEQDLCPICFSEPIDTRFEPCQHKSCHRCIARSMLNNNRCFFCNAEVKSTVAEKQELSSSGKVPAQE